MSKDHEVYEEVCLIDLKQRYNNTPEGKQQIEDIMASVMVKGAIAQASMRRLSELFKDS